LYSHYLRVCPEDKENAARLASDMYYSKYPMRPTDPEGFSRMLTKIRETKGCELVFLTARSPNTMDFTAANFVQIGLVPEDHIIHFSDWMPKGKYVSQFIDARPYQKVVFIDDLPTNLNSMSIYIDSSKLQLYMFVMDTSNCI
jgi:hypothetical protein